jgi:hypothetical protein
MVLYIHGYFSWMRIRIRLKMLLEVLDSYPYLASYAPLIYTALRADPLRGQVGGGWALEIETFGLCEMALSR